MEVNVRIPGETYALLKRFAEPFEDSPGEVLHRCLTWVVRELERKGLKPSPQALLATDEPVELPPVASMGWLVVVEPKVRQDGLPPQPPDLITIGKERFPLEHKTWSEVLIQAIRYVDRKGRLQNLLPIRSGPTRHIANTHPTHPNGSPFRNPQRVGCDGYQVYVETHWKRSDHCLKALQVIQVSGLGETIRLEWNRLQDAKQ